MADANEKNVRKREREPITLVCFIVFLIACAGILSAYAYNELVDNSKAVVYGETVEIDYTGSLYGYYDAATDSMLPIIFDTTLKSVGDNSNNLFAPGFSKTSYSTTSITLGQGKFLKAFENAIIGHKVGDTIKVKINAADAYPAANTNQYREKITELEADNGFTVSLDEYKTLFDKTEAPAKGISQLEDKNGLPAKVNYDGSILTVCYEVEKDKEYTIVDNSVGKVIMTPTEVTDSKITYKLSIENQKNVMIDDKTPSKVSAQSGESIQEIEMISYNLFNNSYNIIGFDGTSVIYNTASSSDVAIHNMDLFFVIKIVSKK